MGNKPQMKITNTPGRNWKSVLEDSNIVASNVSNHFKSNYIDGVVEELYGRTEYKFYKYQSILPSIMHNLNHNLGTYDLQVEVMVQDPEALTWAKDSVSIEYVSDSVVHIWLTEASNIRVVVKNLFPTLE